MVSTQSHQPTQSEADSDPEDEQQSDKPTITLGLVASPDHAQRVATDIAASLPDLLNEHIDDQVIWEIKNISNPLAGSQVGEEELLDEIAERKESEEWAYAVSLTDLPLRDKGAIRVGGASLRRQVAYISVPALGVARLRSRVQNLVLEMVNAMRSCLPPEADDQQEEDTDIHEGARQAAQTMVSRGIARQVTVDDPEGGVGIRYIAPKIIGHVNLLSGMVYANRPWRLFPKLKTAVAAALATGGYIMIFSSMWEIGNAYTIPRLVLLMFTSMTILTAWIIISHGLWEAQRGATSKYMATVYNMSTVFTIITAVIFAYTIVFGLLLLATAIYIPDDILGSVLGGPVTWLNYLHIAWVAASVTMIAGALGAGLEDTDAVRDATFGWRQRHRFEEYQREQSSE